MKTLYPLLSFILLLGCPAGKLWAQSAESNQFITYDTTFNIGYSGLSYLLHISRPSNADTAARPALIAMSGAGEAGSVNITNRYGPGYWLENGWDGGIQLGNGKHYPIIITVQPNQYWPQTTELLKVLQYLLSAYHIKKNSVHLCGLGMGAFAWSALICHQSSTGGEDGMKLVTSLVCLQGQSNAVSKAVASNELPGYASFGHWAKKYHGKFFGLEGTVDYRNVGAISDNMNDSVPGSAYFSYEKLGGGVHSYWNAMYDPSATNWTSMGTLGPNNVTGSSANAMGTYKAPMNLFQWMLRQGDTSLVITKASSNQPPVSNPGGSITTFLPYNSVTMTGSGTDPDGKIVSYAWTKVSGPAQYTIGNPSISNPLISNLVPGKYTFRLAVTDNSGQSKDSDVLVNVTPVTTAQNTVPVLTPVPLPGKIEAESFYAMSNIWAAATSDAGGGQYIRAGAQGNWTAYTVNAATGGNYTVGFRVATTSAGASFQLRKPDGTVLGSFTAPNTGSYSSWQTVSGTVVLPAGVQTLQLYSSSAVNWDMNWIQFSATPPDALPGKVEAESFDAMAGVITEATTDAGGGKNVGAIDLNDWMNYNVNAGSAGTYTVSFRVATAAAGASFQLRQAGSGAVLASVSLPNTGGYQTWQTVNATVTLPAGAQTLQLYSTSAVNWNINWMQFVTSGAAQPLASSVPIPGKVQAENYVLMSGVAPQTTTDAGGGLNVGSIDEKDWMNYTVTAANAGSFTITFRIATAASGAGFQIKKTDGTVLATLSLPNTGGYQVWQNINATIALPAGTTTVQLYSTSTVNWNLNWMDFEPTPIFPVPGKIEAENYVYMSGIMSEATADAGGGYDIGGIDRGDWINYDVNVAAAGSYTVSLRIATPSAGASFQLKKTDGTVLATVTLPNTGGYQVWQTINATISLPAGVQALQLYSTGVTNWNLNWMQIENTPIAAIPGKIEAENYIAMSGIMSEATSDAGGGYDIGSIDQGDWMNYNVNVATAGTYTVSFRIATASPGSGFQLKKTDGTVLATVSLPNTGGFQSWQTVTARVTLSAGVQAFQLAATSTVNWNINWMQFASGAAAAKVEMNTTEATASKLVADSSQLAIVQESFRLYPNPAQDHFTLDIENGYTGNMNIQIISQSGATIRTIQSQKEGQSSHLDVSCGGLSAGIYFVRVQIGTNWSIVKKVVKL